MQLPRAALVAAVIAAGLATSASAQEAAPQEQRYGKTEGLIPGVLIGPRLSLLSFPSPAIGLELKAFDNLLGASVDYGLIPDVTVKDASAGFDNWNVGAKVYPFRGRFFVGALYGSRSFHASATARPVGLPPVEVKLDISSSYVAPEIGWRIVWDGGFFMGVDLGYQIVLDHTTTLTVPSGLPASSQASVDTARKDVNDAGDLIGSVGLPIVGLLQLGYFF